MFWGVCVRLAKWIGAVAAIGAVGVFTTGCSADHVTGKLGTAVRAGDFQLTAASMTNPADPPDRFTNPKIGNRFVKFDVTIDNLGDQHLPVQAAYFKLIDSGGIENPAMRGIPTDTGLKETSVGPGQHLQVPMYFEMAANLTPVQLVLAPAVVGWSTRISVDLRS